MTPDPRSTYRCPYPDCRHRFQDPQVVPGRLEACPGCDRPMNARPESMEAELRDREARAEGGTGADVARLPLTVLVDNVRSLWNVGSIFRTADACGVAEVVLSGISDCPPRERISKTALGGEQAVAWRYRAEALTALQELEADGFVPVALENGPDGISLDAISWPDRTCIVVGNEVRGVSPEVLATCPLRVSIPMRGVKDTLNVAVAFGIAVYHAGGALARRAR